MRTTESTSPLPRPGHGMPAQPRPERRRRALLGGGADGNELLTVITGLSLIVLLAVLGITILRIHQLISVHLFLGLLLLGPLAVKLASTGYRFVRYYAGDRVYRAKGPPDLLMRAIAPIVVLSTLIVFASGVVLLFEGPARRGEWVAIHKASFIVWLIFTGLHVLGRLERMSESLRARRDLIGGLGGAAGRWIALSGAIIAGVVLAIALIPQFAPWTAHGAFFHHH